VQERAASPALVYAELVLDEDVEGLMVFLCEKLRLLGRQCARRDDDRYVISRPASILAGYRILTHVEDMLSVLHHLQSTPFFFVRLSIDTRRGTPPAMSAAYRSHPDHVRRKGAS
jgi:hypothetical protein